MITNSPRESLKSTEAHSPTIVTFNFWWSARSNGYSTNFHENGLINRAASELPNVTSSFHIRRHPRARLKLSDIATYASGRKDNRENHQPYWPSTMEIDPQAK